MSAHYLSNSVLETVVKNALSAYDPDYCILEPQPVPIEKIIENTFGLYIDYVYLTNNGREFGRVVFDDGFTTFYSMDRHRYELITVEGGTIMIDATLLVNGQQGRLRFTLAHELAHYLIHKKIFEGSGISAALMEPEEINVYEYQANILASYLLMPGEQIKRCYYEHCTGKKESEIINLMSSIFDVSKTSMRIRLHEKGLIP